MAPPKEGSLMRKFFTAMSALFGVLILAQTPAVAALNPGCVAIKEVREIAKKVVASKGAVAEISKAEDLKRLMTFVVDMSPEFKNTKVTSVLISIDAKREKGTIVFIEGNQACTVVNVPAPSAIALYGIATGHVKPPKKGITA
jgi:hypothetical protein